MKILYPLFRENVERNQLIRDHDTIILGFSGGKDSVTLLCLLQELQKEMPFRLLAAYFNHRIRTDAPDEQRWIEDFCGSRGVELVIGGKDVIRFKDEHKLNLEHAASISRYSFFKQVSARFPNAKVATAHSKSDLTETFFIKLLRGSGLQGLTTIYSKKENTVIRPLLVFDQEEILAFLERNKRPFYQDYTNKEDRFLRNRIRRRVVPELKQIEPKLHQHIFKTVSIIQEEYDYFSRSASAVLARHLIVDKVLPAHILQEHHVALQRHIIREYLRLLKGNLLDIDFEHIEAIRTRHSNAGGLAVPGVELSFNKGFIFPLDISIPGYCFHINAPGRLEIKEIGKTISIRQTKVFKKPPDNHEIIVPLQSVKFPLTVRNPFTTDKYVKINSSVNQKVIEMIRASGFPAKLRNLCPVLVNGDGDITWVSGSPAADRFKVKDLNGKEFLVISVT
jgi:tRNA(Ile)-lysidine synthase